jgi:hypothetical protein
MSRAGGAVLAAVFAAILSACEGDSSGTSSPSRRAHSPAPSSRPAAQSNAAACYQATPSGGGTGALRFTDVTDARGLDGPLRGMLGHATAVGDVNGDGWADLFVGTFADRPLDTYKVRGADGPAPDRLLLGGPNGFRVDESFPGEQGRTSGAAFVDLNGDGQLDLVIARNQNDADRGHARSQVLRNDHGHFTLAATLDRPHAARSVGVLDYDGDGRPDLFIAADPFSGEHSVLWHNDGDFHFSDRTTQAGLPTDIQVLGVATADLNGDGFPDLFVAGKRNRMFLDIGDGTLRQVDASVFRSQSFGPEDLAGGIAVGDLNRDGRPDIVLGQHYKSTLRQGKRVPVRLYLNDSNDDTGTPRFRDVTDPAGLIGLPTKAPHVEVADLDADGWPDILTTASADNGTRPAVFHNLGVRDGIPRFEAPQGLGSEHYWVAGATFDANHDGRLDVFLVDFDAAQPSVLLHNDTGAAHWLSVQVGPSGAAGIGTAVEVYQPGGLGKSSQLLGTRQITASTGYSSGSLPVAYFGLGDLTQVDLRIRPPRRQPPIDLPNTPADRLLDVGSAC